MNSKCVSLICQSKLYAHFAITGLHHGKYGILNEKGNRPARSETPCKRDEDCKAHEGIYYNI